MYRWRQLSEKEQSVLLAFRRQHARPWHSPQHWDGEHSRWMLTAACYEHQCVIGATMDRMRSFSDEFLDALSAHSENVAAWCVLPNHYHALLQTMQLRDVLKAIGKLHGRTSRYWNIEDNQVGRKVWFNCAETAIKSDRHYRATLNYIQS